MKNACFLVSLSFVTSFALGCAGSTPLLTAPSSAGLSAQAVPGLWNLVSMQPAGEVEQVKPSGASYTVTFGEGRLSTRVDCNVCTGAFAVSGRTLTVGPALACTRAACPTMAFENAYTSLPEGESTVALSDRTLELSSSRGVLRFTR